MVIFATEKIFRFFRKKEKKITLILIQLVGWTQSSRKHSIRLNYFDWIHHNKYKIQSFTDNDNEIRFMRPIQMLFHSPTPLYLDLFMGLEFDYDFEIIRYIALSWIWSWTAAKLNDIFGQCCNAFRFLHFVLKRHTFIILSNEILFLNARFEWIHILFVVCQRLNWGKNVWTILHSCEIGEFRINCLWTKELFIFIKLNFRFQTKHKNFRYFIERATYECVYQCIWML